MTDRFTPDDLFKKGFEADGNGGFRKVRKAAEPAVKDITRDLEELYPNKKITLPPDYKPFKNIGVVDRLGKITPLIDQMDIAILKTKNALPVFCLPDGETIKAKYVFEINPCPAPRMTRSDQWKTDPYHTDPRKRQRKPVAKYFAWRDNFIGQCDKVGYALGEVLRVLFIMPMPKYLSRNKRETMTGQPHKQRPDTDNMLKSIKDAFKVDDGYVWDERGVKLWGDTGKIIIF